MSRARLSPLLLFAAGLLALACAKEDQPQPKGSAALGRHWPPDTMAVTILGSGRIAVRAAWRAVPDAAPPSTSYLLLGEPPLGHPAAMSARHTPPDTTPAAAVAAAIRGETSGSGGEPLLFAKWPPDTTGR